jgi:hypothetical protein
MELTYQKVDHTNPLQARKRIVHIDQQTQNSCETARRCHTAPQLVRKWVKRYQWTFLESRTRLRLLAFSREMSTLHGMAFLSLAVSWLRLCGVPTEMTIQTDWGEEWGGSNPDKIARLEAEFLRPLGARMGRIPLGRKEYNGRVERSHRTDDEEFYLPCVLSLDTVEAFLGAGLGWLYHYNYERVHSGYGMEGRTPYGCCVALGFEGSAYVGLMPVVLLDDIVLDWSRQGLPAVNDVLTHYIGKDVRKTAPAAWFEAYSQRTREPCPMRC